MIVLAFILSASAQTAEPAKTAKPPAAQPADAAKLPTAESILDRFAKAVGGADALAKVNSRKFTGTLEMTPMGLKGTFETYQSGSDKLYSKMSIAGVGDIISVVNGDKAWTVNPIQGNRDISGEELLQLKLANNIRHDVEMNKLYSKLAVRGVEKVEGRDAYVVVGTPAGLPESTFYFDKENGLLVRSDTIAISPEGRMPIRSFFSDYRDVEGVKIPFKVRASTAVFDMIMNFSEVKKNEPIDHHLFVKPAN